jgi:putative tryptophan/tyrosine transport system substrate-binding protein
LLWLTTPEEKELREELFEGLRRHGYVQGQNLAIEDRTGAQRYEDLQAGARALAESKVDVIVAFGNTSAKAARHATSSTPIVMVAGMDFVKEGLAASLARPGGNVTGFSTMSNDLHIKWVELIRETLPHSRHVGALVTPTSDLGPRYLGTLQAEAKRQRLDIPPFEVRAAGDLEPALAAAAKARVDALFIVPSTMLRGFRQRIGELSMKHRMPWFGYSAEFSVAGALVSYGVNRRRLFRRAGEYASHILKGASPGGLPIEYPSEFELAINLKSAKVLGIAIPPAVRFRATQIIE